MWHELTQAFTVFVFAYADSSQFEFYPQDKV